MKTFLTGATGATGRELAKMLVRRGHSLCLVVRDEKKLPDELRGHKAVTILESALLDLSDSKMLELLSDCDAAISCPGHRLSRKGMYGQPRRLVAEGWLRDTDMPLAKIAEKLDYESEASFNRAFKKFTGCTPGVTRRSAKVIQPKAT